MPGPTSEQVHKSTGGAQTALEKHTSFFDTDGDGIIWPIDTYHGFRVLGFNIFISVFAACVINGFFSWYTMDQWLPDPFFRLSVAGMHKAKHGSDSESFTHKGVYDASRFEDVFSTYTDPPHDTLTWPQTMRMVRGNAEPFDVFGRVAGFLEWTAVYLLLWPVDGKMKKDDIRGVFDGSTFRAIAEANKKRDRGRKLG